MTHAAGTHRSTHAPHGAKDLLRPPRRRLRGGARQGLLAVLDQGVVGGTSFLTMIVVGRVAGADELGVFALALTFIFLAIAAEESLLTVPYTVFVRRLTGRAKAAFAGGTLIGCLALSLSLAAVVVLAAWIAYACGAPLPIALVGFALAPALVFWLVREAARRCSYAEFRAGGSLAASAIVAVIQTAAIGWLAWGGRLSAVSALYAVALGNAAAGLGWLFVARRQLSISRAEIVPALRRNWHLGRWMFAGQAATTLGMYALPWIVAIHAGTAGAGAFAACASVMRLASPFLAALTNVVTPHAAQAFADGGALAVRRVVRAAWWIACSLSGAFCLVVLVAGDWLLFQLFGMGYADYHVTLVLLAAALLASQASLATGRGLIVLERSGDTLKADLISSGFGLATAALLAPTWGVAGAAAGALAGALIAAAVTGLYYLAAVRRHTGLSAARDLQTVDVQHAQTSPLPALAHNPGEAV